MGTSGGRVKLFLIYEPAGFPSPSSGFAAYSGVNGRLSSGWINVESANGHRRFSIIFGFCRPRAFVYALGDGRTVGKCHNSCGLIVR